MAQATLDHMGKACREMGRVPLDSDPDAKMLDLVSSIDLHGLMFDLIVNSRPNWRTNGVGGLTKKGKRIIDGNKTRAAAILGIDRKTLYRKLANEEVLRR